MKNIVLSFFVLGLILSSCNESVDKPILDECNFVNFKYYKGKKEVLGEMSNHYLLIGIKRTYTNEEIREYIAKLDQFEQSFNYQIYDVASYGFKEIPLQLKDSKTCNEITQIISKMKKDEIISYVHYTMKTDDCSDLFWEPVGGISNDKKANLCVISYGSEFSVKVIDENDLTNLNKIISKTNTELVEQDKYMPKWFHIRATKKSNGDALEMANYFYETGLFEHSEPSISKYLVK